MIISDRIKYFLSAWLILSKFYLTEKEVGLVIVSSCLREVGEWLTNGWKNMIWITHEAYKCQGSTAKNLKGTFYSCDCEVWGFGLLTFKMSQKAYLVNKMLWILTDTP